MKDLRKPDRNRNRDQQALVSKRIPRRVFTLSDTKVRTVTLATVEGLRGPNA